MIDDKCPQDETDGEGTCLECGKFIPTRINTAAPTVAYAKLRKRKVHYWDGKRDAPMCATPVKEQRGLVTGFITQVTCLICLYHLGLHTTKDGRSKPTHPSIDRRFDLDRDVAPRKVNGHA